MTSRRASDKANTVSLFPFLAVLLCTMGSLLVLLVVLAQRASKQAEQTAGSADPPAVAMAEVERPMPGLDEAPKLEDAPKLDEFRRRREQFETKLAEIESRIEDEKIRLGHLEEHNRRVEHDLAKLYVANAQLKAVEEDQLVDQVQAEQELARLESLVAAAEEDLEAARQEYAEQPGKTLFVYRGPNGTTRPPVYIECNSAGVTLQPEGVTLAPGDFQTPLRAGNALALAVRATQDYAGRQQLKAGRSVETPYPLVIVRPGGRKQFNRVVRALTAADLQYGYEFLGADAVLEYAAADPGLAEVQHHAVLQARSRQELLAMAAPSRFGGNRRYQGGGGGGHGLGGGLGGIGGGSHATGRTEGSDAAAEGGLLDGVGSPDGRDANGGVDANGDSLGGGNHAGEAGAGLSGSEPSLVGSMPGDANGGVPTQQGGEGNARGVGDLTAATSGMGGGGAEGHADRYAQGASGRENSGDGENTGGGNNTGGGQSAQASSGSGGSEGASGGSAAAGAASRQAQQGGVAGSSTQAGQSGLQAEAARRGANWAVAKPSGGAVAMRRPIRVVVAPGQLSVLPSRHRIDGAGQAKVISLEEPPRRVLDQFSRAIRDHMAEWGLAGRGMHWRPVLVLEVRGDADEQARQLARALERGGVDVQLPSTADARTGGSRSATR